MSLARYFVHPIEHNDRTITKWVSRGGPLREDWLCSSGGALVAEHTTCEATRECGGPYLSPHDFLATWRNDIILPRNTLPWCTVSDTLTEMPSIVPPSHSVLCFVTCIWLVGCDNGTSPSQSNSVPMASVKTKSEIRCEDGAMTLFYQTGLWLSSLAPGEKVRFYRGRDAFTDSVANGDGRIEFFTETSAWKVPEISLVHGEDSSAWSPLDSMYTESAGYSPVKFSLALFTDSAHGGVKHYDYSLLASDTAARRIPCGTGYFGSTWSATDTLNLPITRLILDVTWDGWANSSLIELGIPDKVTGRDSIFLMERNNFPVIYDAPNPMRRIKSSIWSEIKAQPMIVAIGLGTEEFRILIRNEGLAE